MSMLRWPSYYDRLSNDIDVIIWPTDSPHLVVLFIFGTGQQHFPDKYSGLSHFVEHLMFQGNASIGSTEYSKIEKYIQKMHDELNKINYTNDLKQIIKIRNSVYKMEKELSEYITHNDFTRLLTSMGASYVNASTYSQVVKYEVILWHKDNLLDVLNLFYNQFVAPVFYTFVTEQNIILHEMVMSENQRELRVRTETLKNSYLEHPIIGYKSTLISITPKVAYDYIKTYYQPRHLTILLAGNTDYHDIEWIKQVFEKMPNSFTFYFPTSSPVGPIPRQGHFAFQHQIESRFFSNLIPINNIKEKTIAMLINYYLNKTINTSTHNLKDLSSYLFNECFVFVTETNRDTQYTDAKNDILDLFSAEKVELIKNMYYDDVRKSQKNSAEMLDFISDTYMNLGPAYLNKIKKMDEIIQVLTHNDVYHFVSKTLSEDNLCTFDFINKRSLPKAILEQNDVKIDIDEETIQQNHSQISPEVMKICQEYEKKYKPKKVPKYLYSTELYEKYKNRVYVFNKRLKDLLNIETFAVLILEKKSIDIYEENVLYHILNIAKNQLGMSKTKFDVWNMYDSIVLVSQGYDKVSMLKDFMALIYSIEELSNNESNLKRICNLINIDFHGVEDIKVSKISKYNENKVIFTFSNMLFYDNYDKIKISPKQISNCIEKGDISRIMRSVLSNAHFYYHGVLDSEVKDWLDKIDVFLSQYNRYGKEKRVILSHIDRPGGYTVQGAGVSQEASILRAYPLGRLNQEEIAALDAFTHYALSISYPSLYNLIRTTYGLSYMIVANYYIIDGNTFFVIEFGMAKENVSKGEKILNESISKCIKELKNNLDDFIKKQGTLNTQFDNIIYKPIHCVRHFKAISNDMDKWTFDYDLINQDADYIIEMVHDKIYRGKYINLFFDL